MSIGNPPKSWRDLPEDVETPHIRIKWQHGPVAEEHHNGAHVDEVMRLCLQRLQDLNETMPCRENSLAITKLQESLMWLDERTRDRIMRDVAGTNKP